MLPNAIEKAEFRIRAAEQSLHRLSQTLDPDEFRLAWSDFLVALNGVYTALGEGSKSDAKSRQWFAARKQERKSDELLQYLHQARNSDEHGIDPIFESFDSFVQVGSTVVASQKGYGLPLTHEEIKGLAASGEVVIAQSGWPKLITVKNSQFGDTFDPPTTHRGKRLHSNDPYTVAELAWISHKALLESAKKLG